MVANDVIKSYTRKSKIRVTAVHGGKIKAKGKLKIKFAKTEQYVQKLTNKVKYLT